MIKPKLITSKDEINPNPSKVGQAVYDVLKKDQPDITVQEIIDAYSDSYTKEMESTLKNNVDKYRSPFYVVVLTKKEPWALNVVRNWFIARQTKPKAGSIKQMFPAFSQTVYLFNGKTGELRILWSLPIEQDARVVRQNKQLYDPQLVSWISDYDSGKLDRD